MFFLLGLHLMNLKNTYKESLYQLFSSFLPIKQIKKLETYIPLPHLKKTYIPLPSKADFLWWVVGGGQIKQKKVESCISENCFVPIRGETRTISNSVLQAKKAAWHQAPFYVRCP